MKTVSIWSDETIGCGTDPLCGASIAQLTSEPVTSHNIYCEQRFASADGRRIALQRRPFGRAPELWVCDLPTMRLVRVATGVPVAANAPLNAVYLVAGDAVSREGHRLLGIDLADLTVRELHRFKQSAQTSGFVSPDAPKGTISPDERWFVGGPFHVRDNRFALQLVDLVTGAERALCEVEDLFNPHLQFDPGNPGRLLVQVNRGGIVDSDGTIRQRSGPNGSTLAVVEVPSGELTPLPVGAPDTPRISGHQCWTGGTGEVIFTAAPGVTGPLLPATGVYGVTPGNRAARGIALGRPYNHLAVSDDGRFFIVDDYRTLRIHVGSLATGKTLELCDSHTRQGRPQHTHVHPYLTPDLRFVIFNSCATGVAQVYAARVPDGFLDNVLEASHAP